MNKFIQKTLEKLEKLDIGAIRALFSQLAAENDLLAMVLHSMTDGVLVTDSNCDLILYNKSAERLLPFTDQDILEKKIWTVVSDAEISGFFREKLSAQENVTDKTFTLGNPMTRTIALSIMPLVKQGKIRGNLVHIEDVTEKKSNEARLRRAESLAALTTLAAGVAHEIKNPLGSIAIHLQLAQKEMNGKKSIKPESLSRYLTVINEEVDRLNRIIVDFLFAVRPMNVQLEERDVNTVIRDLVTFLKFELENAKVATELRLADDLPRILIDEKYVKQALLNLIQNSMSAMPGGGTLTIATRRKGPDVLIAVTDSGSGIPDSIMEKIFEPYFTTKEFGSGLGLTLVYKIVKEHMGEVSVTSREGKGTTFTLSFGVPQKETRMIPDAREGE
ncbi:MAG: PAS domain S-box protein [Spirochaetales bacterium]|nr:PAS domain S-box protein [Spirochaetales bacterium]